MARIHVPACFTTCADIKNSLDARNLPEWINDGKQLLSSLESVKARLEDLDLHQETRKSKARRCRLIREISRLYSCIHDCLELMEQPRIMRGRLFVWNPERGTTRYLQLLRYDANRIIPKCESFIQNPGCHKNDDYSTPPTNLVTANPRTANDISCTLIKSQIVSALLKKEELPVLCVWGNTGTGKTTLAKKIFQDRDVRRHFNAFAWVSLKEDVDVDQKILMQLLPNRKEDIQKEIGSRLNEMMFIALLERRCLVVLEDVHAEDLQRIRMPSPSGHSISKFLITTPLEHVAKAVTFGRVSKMPPLAEDECLNMLKEKANFDDPELHSVGKAVFRLSRDSPLLALVLGISLKTMDVPSRDQLLHQLDSIQLTIQIGGGETEVLRLICDRLPHQLRSCLLYMGQFPKGQDIQIEKLYLLLAAEDLIMSPDNCTSGKQILDELTRRMLVEVTSMYKSCRLHGQIRNFCISQGIQEKYFNIVDFKGAKYLRIPANRLAIYLSNYRNGSRIGYINKRRICSLLIFDTNNSGQTSWPSEITNLKDFIFLRVLDFHRVNFGVMKLPKGIDKLLLLRYLSFHGCFLETFPSFFSKFKCLETLDLRTKCKMTIPNVLNDLKKLRHLFFPMEYESADNSKLQLHGLQTLEILVNFDAGLCEVDDLCSLNNIRILTVISQGSTNELDGVIQYSDERAASNMQLSVSITNFECYSAGRVARLKKLLECKCIHSVHIKGLIGRLPKDVSISPNITDIVFDGSELEDDHILKILGNLENLRSLALLNDAFEGKEMTFSAGSWSNLRILKLQNLRGLEKITFEESAMPVLSTLVVENCEELKKVVMPRALDSCLKLAITNEGDDVYSVEPLPTIID